VWFRQFGFISLPFLALTAFLLIIAFLLIPYRRRASETDTLSAIEDAAAA
jgi:hypothetical protein